VSAPDQDKAAKRAQWEEINRAKALAKQQQKESAEVARSSEPKKQFQAVKGTRDLLPPETSLWNSVESTARAVFGTFGFGEIRTPIFEQSYLFARSIGLDTDVVSKEMYSFEDHDFPELARLRAILSSESISLGNPQAFQNFSHRVRLFSKDLKQKIDEQLISRTPENEGLFNSIHTLLEESMYYQKRLAEVPQSADSGEYGRRLELATERIRAILREVFLGDEVTLRPEATASVCRAYIEHNMNQLPQPVKLYYMGPMFRRERPQKGRYRQFYQIGAEVLGGNDAPAIDAEVIEMVMTFFDKLELPGLQLDINSIGHNAPDCRPKYVELLREELREVKDRLGADSQRRIETNPLRVLDSKLESEQPIIAKLPRIADHLCDACKAHYAEVKKQLQLRGVIYKENWRLVRGLDYYMRTTFEITAKGLGSQNAVCGGGRYDGLVELLGGPPTKGIGFAIGEDRLILSLQDAGKVPAKQGRDVYIAWMGEHAYAEAVRTAKLLRNAGFSVELPPSELKFGKALERASKLDSRYALILGDNEVSEGFYTLKTLADGTQQKFTEPQLLEFLQS
jgi:histidyl-tRNA synthetase